MKAQRDLERIKIEAEQKITQAKAEAESLRLQKENGTPYLIQPRQIEAKIKAIEKWNGQLPKLSGGAIPFIDMKSLDEKERPEERGPRREENQITNGGAKPQPR